MPSTVLNALVGKFRVQDLIGREVLRIGDGYRAKNSEFASTGLPFARAGNVNGGFHFDDADFMPLDALHRVGEKISQSGDVVFTSKGTVGRFSLVTEDTRRFVYAPQLCYWRSTNLDVLDPRYLYYWMHGAEFSSQIHGLKSQTDMADYVSLGDQKRIFITLPPVSEQRAIAHVLGTLDDKIELNRRLSQTLEELARTLFTAWFVTFEPVRAKAAGRAPEGMDAATAALFPCEFVESELGEIPAGWRTGTFSDVAIIARDTISPLRFPDEIFDYYSIPAFDATKRPASEPGSAIRSNKTVVTNGAILISKLNPHIPRVWLPEFNPSRRAISSTEFLVIVPTSSNQAFLLSLLSSDLFYQKYASLVTGTTGSHQRVPPEGLLAARVVIPPEGMMTAFRLLSAPLLDLVLTKRQESATLASLRDHLLPRLLSGELQVPDVENLATVAVA